MLKLVITPQSIIHKGYSVSSKDVFFFLFIYLIFLLVIDGIHQCFMTKKR